MKNIDKILEQKVELNTKSIFQIISLINKMGVKKELLRIIKETSEIQGKSTLAYQKLKKVRDEKGLENTDENTDLLLKENPDIAQEIKEAQVNESDMISIMFEVADVITEKIPSAEKDTYKLLANLYNITSEEVENVRGYQFVGMIMGVIKSEDFSKALKMLNFS